MTDLEVIKKAQHERIWLEPVEDADPYTGQMWCEDNQWGDKGVEYVLASTLESLQRENEHLSADVKREAELATHMANDCNDAQARAEAAEAEVKRLRDLLRFSHDTLWEINPSNYDHDDVCKLNDASVEVILAIAPELGETHGKSKEWWDERQALASTGGEHHGN